MSLEMKIKEDWAPVLAPVTAGEGWAALAQFVESEYAAGAVYPPRSELFTALALTGFAETRVVILGQDPYHGQGQAHGLAFSVKSEAAKFPPSLRNIFRELETDLGAARSERNLSDWAEQGVLLLNTVLTVRAGEAASHRGRGWEALTDAVIMGLAARARPAVFVLWGADAQKKRPLIDEERHAVIATVHPSPLSARRGFFGSRPFSRINAQLEAWGEPPIHWT